MNATENGDGDDGDSGPGVHLERVRTDPRWHLVGLGVALALGILVASVHWVGLVLGGMLVGLVSKTLPRAILGAVGFGILVLAIFALLLGSNIRPVLEMTPVTYLVVGAAIGLPVLGSLARGAI